MLIISHQIKQVISDFIATKAQEDTSPHTLWETLKCSIRGETIKFCALRKKILNRKQYLLESKINAMESLLNICLNSEKDTLLSRISNSRNDLDQLIQISANGAAIRSRACWVELGEKTLNVF